MIRYIETILAASDRLERGRGLSYLERLQLERAVFRLTAAKVLHEFGRPLRSMSATARDELMRELLMRDTTATRQHVRTVELGFSAMRLISSIANVDPYVLNENISRTMHRYSTGVATLPIVLRELATAQSDASIHHASRHS